MIVDTTWPVDKSMGRSARVAQHCVKTHSQIHCVEIVVTLQTFVQTVHFAVMLNEATTSRPRPRPKLRGRGGGRGRGQIFEAEAEAKFLASGHFDLENLT